MEERDAGLARLPRTRAAWLAVERDERAALRPHHAAHKREGCSTRAARGLAYLPSHPRAYALHTYTPPAPLTQHEQDIDAERAAMGLCPMRDAPTTPHAHASQRHLSNTGRAFGIRTYTTD